MSSSGNETSTGLAPGPTMSYEDIQILTAIAQNLNLNFATLVSQTLVYGAYVIICGLAVYSLLTRPEKPRSKGTWLLLSALIVTFLFTTVTVAIVLVFCFAPLQKALIANPELPFLERINAYNSLSWIPHVQATLNVVQGVADSGLIFIVNDILATWRALAICTDSRLVDVMRPILFFLIFSNCVLFIPTSVWQAMIGLGMFFDRVGEYLSILIVTSSSLSMAINLIATGMIAYRAWQCIRAESASGVRFPTGRVLAFLVESGVFYAMIQTTRLALVMTSESHGSYTARVTATNIWESMGYILIASYPPALILVITHRVSITDTLHLASERNTDGTPGTSGYSPRGGSRTVSKIQFARPNGRASRVDSDSTQVSQLDEVGTPFKQQLGQEKGVGRV